MGIASPPDAPVEGAEPLPNPRQEAFCRLLARGLSQVEAYEQAGYAPNANAASRLVRESDTVRARVAFLRAEFDQAIQRAAVVDTHRIQQELEALALSDIGDFFEEADDNGRIVARVLPITRWPKQARRAIQSVKVKRYTEGFDDNAREVELLEFKLWPKVESIRQLREHMGIAEPVPIQAFFGVVALPVMQVPVPSPTDRVIDGDAQVVAVHEPAGGQAFEDARRAVLSRLRAPQRALPPHSNGNGAHR